MAADEFSGHYAKCPVCSTRQGNDADYFMRAFKGEGQCDAVCETMSDTLGYCIRHGALLASHDEFADAVAQVFLKAIPRILPLLVEDFIHEEQVQKILFPAAHACPACRFDDQRHARHARRFARDSALFDPQTLCFDHFQLMARELKPEARLPVLIDYLGMLEASANALLDGHAEIGDALERIAGWGQPDAPAKNVIETFPDFTEAIRRTDLCPVCLEVSRARQRWIDSVRQAARFRQDGWLFFPSCPRHIQIIAALGEPETTVAVVGYALDNACWRLRQEIQALAKQIEASLEGTQLPKRRRRRRKKGEDASPKPARRTVCCQGCERLDIAREHAESSLLELLKEKRHRDALSNGYGLCMKHFASVYLIAPKGKVRSLLAEVQRERLGWLEAELQRNAGLAHPSGETTWRTAIHRFCGDSFGLFGEKETRIADFSFREDKYA